jgi:iron complex transport system ATP-binding protein
MEFYLNMALLDVKNLSCGYGGKTVIKDVSFSVREGDFLGIIGPNGAGKTTLFRSITQTLPIQKGEVFYSGLDITEIAPRKLALQMAVVPQMMYIPFAFTVEEFVFIGRFPHLERFQAPTDIDYRALKQALELADISGLAKRNILELSGGERQMAILAQGFAQEPKILLLDEPTAHLDITHQIKIMDLLKKLNIKEGLTIVIILHDLNLASEYCNRLVLLNEGEVFKEGAPETVLTYDNIEAVYKTVVVVNKNPISSKPYVILVSGNQLCQRN